MLLDELVEVEVAVELVGLGARIAENAALVERLGHLRRRRNVSGRDGEGDEAVREGRTSSTRFGVMRSRREPVFCSSTVVRGSGFLGRASVRTLSM